MSAAVAKLNPKIHTVPFPVFIKDTSDDQIAYSKIPHMNMDGTFVSARLPVVSANVLHAPAPNGRYFNAQINPNEVQKMPQMAKLTDTQKRRGK